MAVFTECSLMKEIAQVETSIKTCYDRVKSLERDLLKHNIEESQRKTVETELVEVKKLLASNEKILKTLHGHNRKTFMIAIAFALILFAVWMLYILARGSDF